MFGESALQGSNSLRMATVKADGPVTTLQLSRVRVIELLGDLTDLIRQNFNMKARRQHWESHRDHHHHHHHHHHTLNQE